MNKINDWFVKSNKPLNGRFYPRNKRQQGLRQKKLCRKSSRRIWHLLRIFRHLWKTSPTLVRQKLFDKFRQKKVKNKQNMDQGKSKILLGTTNFVSKNSKIMFLNHHAVNQGKSKVLCPTANKSPLPCRHTHIRIHAMWIHIHIQILVDVLSTEEVF